MSGILRITGNMNKDDIEKAFSEAGFPNGHELIGWKVEDLINYLDRGEYKEEGVTIDVPMLVEKVKTRLTHCTIREIVLDQFSEAIDRATV